MADIDPLAHRSPQDGSASAPDEGGQPRDPMSSADELRATNEELRAANARLAKQVRELENSADDLANLLMSTDIATLFLDSDLRIQRVTPATTELMNVLPSDAGRPLTDLRLRLRDIDLAEDARQTLVTLQPFEREVRTDGGHWFQCRIHPYRTSTDQVGGVVVTFTDIHMQKTAEELLEARVSERTAELETANAKLRAEVNQRRGAEQELANEKHLAESVLDTAVDAIIMIDGDGTIESCNRATHRIFGYEPGELEGQNVSVLMPSPDRDRHDGYIARYVREGNPQVIGVGREVEALRKDGTRFPADLAVGEDGAGHHGRRFVGIVRDISDRRRLESEARHSQKMEAVGRLASGVAHDFNNLLMGIIGCLDAMRKHLDEDSPARRYANEVRHAAERGTTITRQLLDFTRKSDLKPTRVFPAEVVRSMATMMRQLSGLGGSLDIRVDAADSLILCDRGQLEQAILNLVVNARDAVDAESGRIVVSVRDLPDPSAEDRWRDRIDGPHLEIAVADNGCGMDPATRERIFEPFFTTKDPARGTGLGLSMVFGAIESCHGSIDVDTTPGVGTTFRVAIPVTEGGRETRQQLSSDDEQVARLTGTVLLVDDELLIRVAIAEYLMDAGLRVLTAGHAEEAIQLARDVEYEFDVLVTDVVLPEVSGPRLARQLAERRHGLPVLFMSAHSATQLVAEGRVPPDAAVLEKPFHHRDLLDQLGRLMAPMNSESEQAGT